MYLPLGVCVFCFGDVFGDAPGGGVISCENNRFITYPDGERFMSIPFMPVNILEGLRCPDCNVRIGGFHHPGCENEICPRCGGMLIDCGCMVKKMG